MNMLFGITVLAGLSSSNSSFSEWQVSGSLLFTGGEEMRQGERRTEKPDLDKEKTVYRFLF